MYEFKNISNLKERFDVRYHLSEQVDIEEFWTLEELKEIIVRDPNCYGFNYSTIGIPIIRISDLKQPFIDFSKVAKISPDVHSQFAKTQLKENDILVSVRGVSAGKVGIFLGETEEANISPNIIIIRLKDSSLAPYVTMLLISSIGQSQISQFISGAGKPSLTAPMINRIQIPKPSEDKLQQIQKLWDIAKWKRLKSGEILKEVNQLFDESFSHFKINKKLTTKKTTKELGKRWDPHYHNDGYLSLREFIKNTKLKKNKITKITDYQSETVKIKNKEEKIQYIEIGSVNNLSGVIDEPTFDYPDLLPSNTKIELLDGDILISKVRPYLNSNTIFNNKSLSFKSTASKNAFSIFRTTSYYHKFYLIAFLRHEIGLHQIIMRQSGTSYPTVSDDDIKETIILSIDEQNQDKINDLYKEYMEIKIVEEYTRNAILELIEEDV
jgi:type I restriction enzyme, S subunit